MWLLERAPLTLQRYLLSALKREVAAATPTLVIVPCRVTYSISTDFWRKFPLFLLHTLVSLVVIR